MKRKNHVTVSAASPALVEKFHFQGVEIDAVRDGTRLHVGVKSVCAGLGVAMQVQLRKINSDEVLRQGITMMVIPSAGGAQETAFIDVRLLPSWLATIRASKVRPRIRPKLIDLKWKCADAISEHFFGQRVRDLPKALEEHAAPLKASIEKKDALIVARERDIETLRAENQALRANQNDGIITTAAADWIKAQIGETAKLFVDLGWCRKKQTIKAARRLLLNGVFHEAQWGHERGQDIAGMPAGRYPNVRAWLKAQRDEAERELARRGRTAKAEATKRAAGKQIPLPLGEALPVNSNASRTVA